MTEVEMFDIFNEEMIIIGKDSRANVHANYINLRQFQDLLSGDTDFILTEGIVLDELNQSVRNINCKFHIHDFTPKSSEYYQVLFDNMDCMSGG